MLLTDNRNGADPDSLEQVISQAYRDGRQEFFPVATLGSKSKFENDTTYAERVAVDVADILFALADGPSNAAARVFVPFGTSIT